VQRNDAAAGTHIYPESLDRFEGRSSFRTWLLGIVVNLARSRARAERRSIQMPSELDGPVVDPSRFLPANHARWPHHWAVEPVPWPTPEEDLLAGETRTLILETIDTLPATQPEVLVLRDLEGLSATEVCNVLGLNDTNQRVLLHRALTWLVWIPHQSCSPWPARSLAIAHGQSS